MRLVIVSNRLPVTVSMDQNELSFKASVGGLVSGLHSYLQGLRSHPGPASEYLWIGWPGMNIPGKMKEKLESELESEFFARPVYLSQNSMDKFYHGFCNKTIWPLFHYFPAYTVFDEDYWSQYREVNEVFFNAIASALRPDDLVWVHDYHLMLLPALIRKQFPDASIGFFLHIPFPSYEIFRLLPSRWRSEILQGLLGADLIGFHTHDYTQYFLKCVLRILGHEHNMGKILLDQRIVKAETFPMGIDFRQFNELTRNPEVLEERARVQKTLGSSKLVLSIDRLDYSKGIANRLMGYASFLEKNPEWRGKVCLAAVVVPSRIGVDRYQQMKRQIDELVGEINGRFGTMSWTPVLYQYKFLSPHPLTALYSLCDAALVTPLRDGMNLVSKEYIATRTDKTGVLILSEMAGSAKELGEAILINPNNVEEIADALKVALEMPREEQIRRNTVMQARIKRYDVIQWAGDFLATQKKLKEEQAKFEYKFLSPSLRKTLIDEFKEARRRILFLDYDGTLIPLSEYPEHCVPPESILKTLSHLAADPDVRVVVLSGRKRSELARWFPDPRIVLVAEHGAWFKMQGEEWETQQPLRQDWMPQVLPLLEFYSERLPGTFVEQKEYSLAWHYRRADPELGPERAKELADDLAHYTVNTELQVLPGNKVVEVRSARINKGVAGSHFLLKEDYDFILAAGDDWTDEDLFKALPDSAHSIKVGMSVSYARFNLHSPFEVQRLLEELAAALPARTHK